MGRTRECRGADVPISKLPGNTVGVTQVLITVANPKSNTITLLTLILTLLTLCYTCLHFKPHTSIMHFISCYTRILTCLHFTKFHPRP